MTEPIRGIAGLTGKEPIGAALTVGKKGSNGAPTEKDRFHIMLPVATTAEFKTSSGKAYSSLKRDPHPSFNTFNSAAPETRKIVPARLVHAVEKECFEYKMAAQQITVNGVLLKHPKKAPVCTGDGVHAQRWDEKAQKYVEIPCPGDRCPFTQKPASGPTPCKPWMRFIARFDFPPNPATGRGLPSIPFKYTSASWNTVGAFKGFFDSFTNSCRGMGIDPALVPLFGLPVVLMLAKKDDPVAKTEFPIVSISVAGDGDLLAWIQFQAARLGEVRKMIGMVPALTDPEQQEPDVLGTDFEIVSGPQGIPR